MTAHLPSTTSLKSRTPGNRMSGKGLRNQGEKATELNNFLSPSVATESCRLSNPELKLLRPQTAWYPRISARASRRLS